MKYLIDTDWVIDYLKGTTDATELLQTMQRDGIGISIVTFAEIYEGIYGSRDPRRRERDFGRFLRGTRVLHVTRDVAKRHARLRHDLRQQRRQVDHRTMDLLIAATALTARLTLVTRNRTDYSDIPGLQLH